MSRQYAFPPRFPRVIHRFIHRFFGFYKDLLIEEIKGVEEAGMRFSDSAAPTIPGMSCSLSGVTISSFKSIKYRIGLLIF